MERTTLKCSRLNDELARPRELHLSLGFRVKLGLGSCLGIQPGLGFCLGINLGSGHFF